ncbi:MAG: hypothetical protein KAT66_06280 [Candidatus Lokiarchaeota archaeon]|nr:hypothetical protein [Candidatus Lokiarchaeota archaeon]
MSNDIFQLDWIFIDTIIIVLLILLLLGVKLYKLTHRWRFSFSNEALEFISYRKPPLEINNQSISTSKWTLTRNISLREEINKKPLIIILRTNYKKRLLYILTEGLSSYGFNVINLRLKIRLDKNNNLFDKALLDNIRHLISTVIDFFKEIDSEFNLNYLLLNYSKSSLSYTSILTDPKNCGMILINPKLNNKNIKNYNDIFKSSPLNSQLYTIFSKRSIFILNNKNLKRLLSLYNHQKEKKLNIITIKKAKYSFNYYETILLGMIIRLIENKLLKAKN